MKKAKTGYLVFSLVVLHLLVHVRMDVSSLCQNSQTHWHGDWNPWVGAVKPASQTIPIFIPREQADNLHDQVLNPGCSHASLLCYQRYRPSVWAYNKNCYICASRWCLRCPPRQKSTDSRSWDFIFIHQYLPWFSVLGTVGAEFIVAAKIIVAATLASLFST